MKAIIKDLRIGVIISETDPAIVACLDGTFRLLYSDVLENPVQYTIILFEDSKSDEIEFVAHLDEFDYYTNIRGSERSDYDEFFYQKYHGLCVPKKILSKSNKFIIDNGYGYQFVIYYFNEQANTIYADSRYTKNEQLLISSHFNKNQEVDINSSLQEIDRYLIVSNIEKILESFTIENKEYFKNKIGGDDRYYIKKESMRFDDGYIDSLFPHIDKTVYSDSGYCDAYSMRIDFDKREYIEEEKKYIRDAKKKYDKDSHRRWLIAMRIEEFMQMQKFFYEKKIKLINSFLEEYIKLLKNDEVNVEFINQHNYTLRKMYRIANNGDEIEGHNFYNKITR